MRDRRGHAFELHEKGDFSAAESIYAEVLHDDPNDVEVLRLMGVLALQTGRDRRAEEVLVQALELDRGVAATHGDLAAALMSQHRPVEALICLDEAIRLEPDYVPALINRSSVLMTLDRHSEALQSSNRAAELWPQSIDACLIRVAALLELERPGAAFDGCQQAIALQPGHAQAHYFRGCALAKLARWEEALRSYERAIALDPMHAAALENHGCTLLQLGRPDEALESCNRGIGLFADSAGSHANRGRALQELNKASDAVDSCDRAIELDPGMTAAHLNRAAALNSLGRLEEALASCHKVMELQPDHAPAHFAAGLTCLRAGQWECGWPLYEWRSRPGGPVPARTLPKRAWTGQENLRGKVLFVHCEQGLGDTIQFCRYVPLVAALGARVILEVQPELAGLLADLQGVAELVTLGSRAADFDYHCSLMSLPFLFKTNSSTIPARIPYLKCSAEKSLWWRERVGAATKPRVGLVWAGGIRTNQPETWSVSKRRDIAFTKLAPLMHPGIEFYSLQKGQTAELEMTDALSKNWDGPQVTHAAHLLGDFSDTAALIEQLDLVISVDTSTAHLAGALGKPVWILNRFDSCWRWQMDRDDSPWYPTARLYRQDTPGNWEGVVERVAQDLKTPLVSEVAAGASAEPRQ